jgi:hypothetical protein
MKKKGKGRAGKSEERKDFDLCKIAKVVQPRMTELSRRKYVQQVLEKV